MSYKPFEFDPFKLAGIDPDDIPKKERKAALRDVATYVQEEILSNTAAGTPSVEGGKWKKKLSPGYKEVKKEESGVTIANLELTGEMMDSFQAKANIAAETITLKVSADQAGKADGNLTGSYGESRADYSRAREFMPHKRGQKLTEEIVDGIRDILERYKKD